MKSARVAGAGNFIGAHVVRGLKQADFFARSEQVAAQIDAIA